ncbi:MAG: multiprotein bridging factor aMBF1 [Candidatus Bathyarchaeia archaeon]
MQCEVCGREIIGKPYKAIIEGAKMIVCGKCVKLGSVYWEARPQRRVKEVAKPQPKISIPGKKQPPPLTEALELVDDFGLRVRRAREGLELSHEDLGRKIGEKVSVLRKIESGKMTPDHRLAEKLEHALKVKLLVPPLEPKAPSAILSQPREITLGEIVRLKEKKTEAARERKQS